MYKSNMGITLIALVVTITIMLILAAVGINMGREVIDKSKLEDIKTNMLAIQGKAKIIAEKNSFDKNEELIGIQIVQEDGIYKASGYAIKNELQNSLNDNNSDGKSKYYIWTEEDLKNEGLKNIKIDVENEKFYIVDYKTGEVFYALGYEGKYSLKDLKDL